VRYLRCRINRWLPARLDRLALAHTASCLRCQAREARSRMIRRELAALAGELLPAPSHLAAAVLARLGEQGAVDPRRRPLVRLVARHAATAGVAAAATAAVLTGLARRRSRLA
jgi:anti-sigma factor RsiW